MTNNGTNSAGLGDLLGAEWRAATASAPAAPAALAARAARRRRRSVAFVALGSVGALAVAVGAAIPGLAALRDDVERRGARVHADAVAERRRVSGLRDHRPLFA